MVYSEYMKLRILFYHFKGLKAPIIARYLQAENINCARQNVAIFIKKYRQIKSIRRRSGSGRPSKLTAEVKAIVEEETRKDDETTAHQLHQFVLSRGYRISLRTILRCRTSLGWTFRGSAYCQSLLLSVIVHTYRWSVKINDARTSLTKKVSRSASYRLRSDFVQTSFFKTIRYCITIVLRKRNIMLFLTSTVQHLRHHRSLSFRLHALRLRRLNRH